LWDCAVLIIHCRSWYKYGNLNWIWIESNFFGFREVVSPSVGIVRFFPGSIKISRQNPWYDPVGPCLIMPICKSDLRIHAKSLRVGGTLLSYSFFVLISRCSIMGVYWNPYYKFFLICLINRKQLYPINGLVMKTFTYHCMLKDSLYNRSKHFDHNQRPWRLTAMLKSI